MTSGLTAEQDRRINNKLDDVVDGLNRAIDLLQMLIDALPDEGVIIEKRTARLELEDDSE